MPEPKLSHKIQKSLILNARGTPSDIIIPNYYFGQYEMDIFKMTDRMIVTEYEIKISRSDFFADFKKNRREVDWMEGGGFEISNSNKHNKIAAGKGEANRFYFVVPHDLIKPSEVPKHIGLIYCDGGYPSVVKAAPLIHKRYQTIEVYKQLCKNLSFREQTLRSKLNWYKGMDHNQEIERLERELKASQERHDKMYRQYLDLKIKALPT